MPLLPSQRPLFDLPANVAYLNCAYMSPLARSVADRSRQGLDRKRRPWLVTPADFFSGTEAARSAFAQLLGSPATANDVAIVPAASYGMAVACANTPLRPGQRVLCLEAEFPSTILSWREAARSSGAELVLIPRPADDDWTDAILSHIDDHTAVAALPQCHWIDGAIINLAGIAARLRQVGAALALDLTQSLGAMPLDLAAIDPDFLVAAGYKWLLAPYSTGFLYVAPRRQAGRPLEQHWFGRIGSENFGGLIDYPEGYQPGARRFDVGEPSNFALLPGAIAAIEMLLGWGVESVAETIGVMTADIVRRGRAVGLDAVPDALRAPHYVGLRAPGGFAPDLADGLAASQVYVSIRGGSTLRVTPHVYNEPWEVDRLFDCLAAA